MAQWDTGHVSYENSEFDIEEMRDFSDLDATYLTDLKIEVAQPHIVVAMKKKGITVMTSANTPQARAIVDDVTKLLRSRRRLLAALCIDLVKKWVLLLFALLFCGLWLAGRDGTTTDWESLLGWSLVSLSVAPVVVPVLSQALLRAQHPLARDRIVGFGDSAVVLKRSREAQPFLKRRREEIIIAFVAALFGALLTLLVQWLLQRLLA